MKPRGLRRRPAQRQGSAGGDCSTYVTTVGSFMIHEEREEREGHEAAGLYSFVPFVPFVGLPSGLARRAAGERRAAPRAGLLRSELAVRPALATEGLALRRF